MSLAEHRDALLRSGTAVSLEGLADTTGMDIGAVMRWAEHLSSVGRLVVVQHDGTTLIPDVQLDENGGLHWQVSSRTRQLVAWGMGPWAVWDWWQTPNSWITDGRSPAHAVRDGDFDAIDRAIDGMMQ